MLSSPIIKNWKSVVLNELAKLSTTEPPLNPPTCVHYKNVNTQLNSSDMFSSLYQHCFQKWDTHYQTDPRGKAYKDIFPALLRSSLPLHSLSPILSHLCTGHCQLNHHLSRIGFHPDYMLGVKYPKRWTTLLKSAPNTWRREIVWNLHSTNSVFLFIPRKSSVAQLLQSLWKRLCEIQAFISRIYFTRFWHYKTS